MEHFVDLSCGLSPIQFIDQIKEMPTELEKEHIFKHQKLFEILNEGANNGRRPIVISDKED